MMEVQEIFNRIQVGDKFYCNTAFRNKTSFTIGSKYEIVNKDYTNNIFTISTDNDEISLSAMELYENFVPWYPYATREEQWQRDEEKFLSSNVNHPPHYGGDTPYEVIKVLEAWGFDKNAYRFNAIKYLARGDKKENLKQDLEKAIWYIQREIDMLS